MDTLQKMRMFLQVVESGSFTLAAEQLKTSAAVTSRAVSDLEAHLRTRLLHRTTRKIRTTGAGERYYTRCKDIFVSIGEAEREASGALEHPNGVIRIHTTPSLGNRYIVRAIAGYRALYPDVSFDITLNDNAPDMIEEGFDVSVQMATDLKDSVFVSRGLGRVFSVLCASPSYLARKRPPLGVEDLAEHDCLRLRFSSFAFDQWELVSEAGSDTFVLPNETPLEINNVEALSSAVLAGLGIAALPSYTAAEMLKERKLIRLLPDYTLQDVSVYALYPSRKFIDAKTRTWVDYLHQTLPAFLEDDETHIEVVSRLETE